MLDTILRPPVLSVSMIIADAKRRLDLLAAQSLLQLWLVFAPAPQVQRLLEEAKTSDKAEDGA